jgi:hypothetical protein
LATQIFQNAVTSSKSMGSALNRANHLWVAPTAALPRSYFQAVQGLALQSGWRIEQDGARFHLRAIEPETFHVSTKSSHTRPSNHLAFFNSLGEVHEFLTQTE